MNKKIAEGFLEMLDTSASNLTLMLISQAFGVLCPAWQLHHHVWMDDSIRLSHGGPETDDEYFTLQEKHLEDIKRFLSEIIDED